MNIIHTKLGNHQGVDQFKSYTYIFKILTKNDFLPLVIFCSYFYPVLRPETGQYNLDTFH